ncbi:GPI-GlcNAc transferase complex, PIG-H component-domain-containing protein [Ampelomyces quisqualis]|uniref:GPI-GlcNAc transferase complex, PIG-H component-domain-containing protein n=1 Tax=Ampelomyces quisqualis TaxID=50730 RepID=A0A6A5QPR1_AMPQU|nr:GPI-GlcNAc transferase complex, PIG-H component-domain-containing protein [Ampelomyces quisqualis]
MRDLLHRLSAPPVERLRVVQPTPYTVSYTVSTRSLPQTPLAYIASYVGLLLRMLMGISTVLLLWSRSAVDLERAQRILLRALGRLRANQLLALVNKCQWLYLAPCAMVAFVLVFRCNYTGRLLSSYATLAFSNMYTEESLTVLRGLGIQTSTSSSTYLQAPTTRFIPTTSIQDIFIYEAFKGFEVRFYLAVVVDGEEDVVVVFPSLLPKRAILEHVWRHSRESLWEGKKERRARTDAEGDMQGE